MSLPKLLNRVNALERRVPKPAGGRIAAIIAGAQQIAGREKLPIDTALARAIGESGRPLSISDVDLLLLQYGSTEVRVG